MISRISRFASPGASASRCRMAAGSLSFSAASPAARSVSGRVVAVRLTTGQAGDPGTCTPRASAGTRQACSSEVLQAPGAPVTMTIPVPASLPASSAVSRSRPRTPLRAPGRTGAARGTGTRRPSEGPGRRIGQPRLPLTGALIDEGELLADDVHVGRLPADRRLAPRSSASWPPRLSWISPAERARSPA